MDTETLVFIIILVLSSCLLAFVVVRLLRKHSSPSSPPPFTILTNVPSPKPAKLSHEANLALGEEARRSGEAY